MQAVVPWHSVMCGHCLQVVVLLPVLLSCPGLTATLPAVHAMPGMLCTNVPLSSWYCLAQQTSCNADQHRKHHAPACRRFWLPADQ